METRGKIKQHGEAEHAPDTTSKGIISRLQAIIDEAKEVTKKRSGTVDSRAGAVEALLDNATELITTISQITFDQNTKTSTEVSPDTTSDTAVNQDARFDKNTIESIVKETIKAITADKTWAHVVATPKPEPLLSTAMNITFEKKKSSEIAKQERAQYEVMISL